MGVKRTASIPTVSRHISQPLIYQPSRVLHLARRERTKKRLTHTLTQDRQHFAVQWVLKVELRAYLRWNDTKKNYSVL